jgi:hypothetical protein
MTESRVEEPGAGVEREIDALLAIEPSPQFVARLRARIQAEPRHAARVWPLLTWAGGAVIAALLVALRFWGSGSVPPAAVEALAPATAPSPAAAEVPAAPAIGRVEVPVHAAADGPRRTGPRAAEDPLVLIPRAEQRSLQRVLRQAAREPLRLAQRAADIMPYPVEPPAPIVVPAIVIDPLVPETAEEGDSK